ncbi:MAG: hypothetical protein QW728_05485, partial [Thermoplasmata archaeon]
RVGIQKLRFVAFIARKNAQNLKSYLVLKQQISKSGRTSVDNKNVYFPLLFIDNKTITSSSARQYEKYNEKPGGKKENIPLISAGVFCQPYIEEENIPKTPFERIKYRIWKDLFSKPAATTAELNKLKGIGCHPPIVKNEKRDKNYSFTPKELDSLPDKWEKLGAVLVFNNLPDIIYSNFSWIASYYAEELKADAVIVQKDVIAGEFRLPKMELVIGTKTETVHEENGIKYMLDPMKIMFSSGNIAERTKCSRLRCNYETVVDMFAGIGYFTLPIAKGSPRATIIAIEKNPDAYHYLVKNIALNKVSDRVIPVLGDNRFVSSAYFGKADRVIMGYFPDTWRFLPVAMKLLKASGGVIMYHDLLDAATLHEEARLRVEKAASAAGFYIDSITTRVIKEYSPGSRHCVSNVVLLPIRRYFNKVLLEPALSFLAPLLRAYGINVSVVSYDMPAMHGPDEEEPKDRMIDMFKEELNKAGHKDSVIIITVRGSTFYPPIERLLGSDEIKSGVKENKDIEGATEKNEEGKDEREKIEERIDTNKNKKNLIVRIIIVEQMERSTKEELLREILEHLFDKSKEDSGFDMAPEASFPLRNSLCPYCDINLFEQESVDEEHCFESSFILDLHGQVQSSASLPAALKVNPFRFTILQCPKCGNKYLSEHLTEVGN